MNYLNATGVDIGATRPSIAMANNQREISAIFHTPTIPQRDPAAIITDIACGINSQRGQDGSGDRVCLDTFNMTSSEAPEAEKEFALPYFYRELQVLPSLQPSSAPGLTILVL